MSQQIGAQLGNYRLIRLLGQGGFADVYLGDHLYLKRQVAIKVLRTSLQERQRENFLLEAQRLVDLHHPHIVRMVDFAIEGTTPFLVMEYAPNGTLRSRHPEGTRLPLATIVAYTRDIASALQHLHEQRLIHRDVKPENILVGRSNELLLSDLGIAGIAHATQSLEFQGQVGTVAYMAPEQIRGKPRAASDQYSLGIMVYEWLSGERPFVGDLGETAIQHVMAPPPSLRARVPGLAEAVEAVVGRALAKEPTERFETVQGFAEALQQAIDSQIAAQRVINSGTARRSASVLSSRIKLVSPEKGDEVKPGTGVQPAVIMNLPAVNQLSGNQGPGSTMPLEELVARKQDASQSTGGVSSQSFLQKKARGWKSGRVFRIAATLALIIVLGAGIGWWLMPRPAISVSSSYQQGTTPLGAAGTTLRMVGTHFASHAKLAILLDGTVIPGSKAVESGKDGTLLTALPITSAWPLGTHLLTIGDLSDLFGERGVTIEIVNPGEAHTPGPAGAPSDDFSGILNVTVTFPNETPSSLPLTIRKPGQAGGRVCQLFDDGEPRETTGGIMIEGQNYRQTRSITCSGSYKGGKLTYIETVTSEKITSPTGMVCTSSGPAVLLELDGTFQNHTTISGMATSVGTALYCNDAQHSSFVGNGVVGTWTGNIL